MSWPMLPSPALILFVKSRAKVFSEFSSWRALSDC